MKFIISTNEFNTLISACLNAVSPKSTMPILSNILIEAAHDEIVLTATDLKLGVRCYAPAKVLREGATTLPAKKLAQLIRELTSVNVEMETNEHQVTEIVADSSRFKLNGMSINEFPALPSVEGATKFSLDQAELKEMLFRTAFAVSREDNRYALTGVNMQISQGVAVFMGTDGKRLARASLQIALDPAFSGSYIIPLKTVEEILKNLSEEGQVTVFLMNDKVAVQMGQTTIISKLLSGEYPDIDRVIPTNNDIVVSLHREELMTLLKQMALFTVDTASVRFTFIPGELKLTANSMDVGEGRVSMPVDYNGPKLEIAFNPNYFLDILKHSKGAAVSVGVTDAYNPGVISDEDLKTAGEVKPSPLFVLMPLCLQE